MCCNKNLTDDQLEAMFTVTDEEMEQTEQPMECLTERNKHKCKRCTRFFSKEAVLQQHHCEPQIKKEKCSCCSKTIICANNLLKLLRSCEKATAHPSKRQLRQMTLDWPTSLENGASTPKKLMVEEVQVGGASAEHAEHWKASEIVDFALMHTALTFRKVFNSNNKRDILQRLKEVINSIKPVTEGQTWANMEAVKRLSMCQRLPTSNFKWLTDE